MKDKRFELRLDKKTADQLKSLAKQVGKSQSAIVRDLINREPDKQAGAPSEYKGSGQRE